MNRIYRLIWNQTLGALVPVAEITRSKGGSGASQRSATRHRLAPLSAALALGFSPGPAQAMQPLSSLQPTTLTQRVTPTTQGVVPPPTHPLPTGGQVVSGSVTIGQSGNTLTIDQGSQKAILNWQSFSIGADQTVTFNQPNSSAVALNRVLGSDPSAIFGHLNANGQVFLVNPNGIYFAPGARVNVGGIVASTLDITNQDFLNGTYRFAGSSSAGVRNDGSITSTQGGYVAFIGANVSNNGSIATPEGTTALGAGGSVDLTLAGNSLLSFKVSSAALNALLQNGGVIAANGGTVILSAQARDALLQTVVNNSGVIQAQTVQNHHGTIELLGGDSGTVQVAGTLDASAPNGGDGGHIETSGTHLKVANGAAITTRAASGHDGTWLIDPDGFTIAATGGDISGATLSANLGQGNVTIQSTDGSGSDGNINVNDTVTWNQHTLTLSATNDININTAMNGSGTAGLALEYGQGALDSATNTANYYVNAPVNLASTGRFSTKIGSDGPTLQYTIITSLGSSNSTTGADLQGINSGLARNYVLGANIDASATSAWNSGAGFTPIGPGSTPFSGTLAGLGHTISNLYINRPNADYVGLFGYLAGNNVASPSKDRYGVVRDVGLVNASVTGGSWTGSLIGYTHTGMAEHCYASGGSVTSHNIAGGLIGVTFGAVVLDSHASVAVNGVSVAGGLIGLLEYNQNTAVMRSYATGNVSAYNNGRSRIDFGDSSNLPYGEPNVTFAGGLIGWADTVQTIDQVYATGNVSANGSVSNEFGIAGGLIGGLEDTRKYLATPTISNAYATGTVTADQNVGGIAGWAYDGSNTRINNVYFSGHVKLNLIPGHLPLNAGIGPIIGSGDTGQVAGANRYYDANHFSQDKAAMDSLTSAYINVDLYGRDLPVYSTTSATNGHDAYTQASYAGFDFKNIWWMAPGSTRPILRMEHTSTISNAHQLQLMAMDPGAHYSLANNIDLTAALANASGVWNPSAGFAPVGSAATPFTGSFDGQGHTLNGLNIQQAGTDNVGLFGAVGQAGSVSHIGLLGGSVTGGTNVGELAGVNAGTISDAYATGSVHGTTNVGGLLGLNSTGTASNDYASGSVSGTSNVGGLIGGNSNGTVSSAYATGNVSGTSNVGGLVGENYANSTVTNAYATGGVSGSDSVGGLVGGNSNGTVSNAYATGNVSGSGSSSNGNGNGNGSGSGSGSVGGLVGNNDGTIRDGYWDTTTGIATGIGSSTGTVTGGGGLTSAQMMQQSSFTGFDFASPAWVIYNGHTAPLLNAFLTPLTITADNQSKVYDGHSSTLALLNPSYSISGATTSGHLFGSLTDAYGGAVNAGAYTPNLWSDQHGYRILYVGSTFTITPKALTVSGLSGTDKTYDGSTSDTLAGTAMLHGLIGSETLTLGHTGSGTLASADAGSEAVTTALTLADGTGLASNYTLVRPTLTNINVSPAPLTASLVGTISKVYDGTTEATLDAGNFQLTGFVGGQGASVTQTVGQYASAALGRYVAVSTSLGAGDFTANAGTLLVNYRLPTFASGVGSIIPTGLGGVTGSANRGTTSGHAGIDGFALNLDPRLQWQQSASGKPSSVNLTTTAGSTAAGDGDGTSRTQSPCHSRSNIDPFTASDAGAGTCPLH